MARFDRTNFQQLPQVFNLIDDSPLSTNSNAAVPQFFTINSTGDTTPVLIPEQSLTQSAVGPAAQSSHIQAGTSTPQLSRNYEVRGQVTSAESRHINVPTLGIHSVVGLNCLFPAFPIFNGDRDFHWWITQFEEMTSECSVREKAKLLLLKLGEKVQDCIDALPPHLNRDYDALVDQLRNNFLSRVNDRVWYAELMNRKKSPNETMLNYMRDIQRLIGKLNVHVSQREQYTCNAFLNGLPTKILMQMGPMQDKTASEMLQAAMFFEEIEKKANLERQFDIPPRRVFHAGAIGSNKSTSAQTNHDRASFRGVCFCCGEIGHLKRFCRLRKSAFCTKCNQSGHYFKACNIINGRSLNKQGLAPTMSA